MSCRCVRNERYRSCIIWVGNRLSARGALAILSRSFWYQHSMVDYTSSLREANSMLKYTSWKTLGLDLLAIMFIVGTIGIALKFTTFFGHWVFFPFFPNVCDSAFLVASVLFLACRMKRG